MVFKEAIAKLIDAFLDKIISPDDWLGGSEKGVLNYVDKKLPGPMIHFQPHYKKA